MNFVRLAALLVLVLGPALAVRAAEQPAGPAPSDVIYPRGSQPANGAAPAAVPAAGATPGQSVVFAPVGGAATGGTLPALGYIAALGVLVAGAWFLLKRGSIPRPFAKSDGRLRVLETRLLGNRQFLVVVEYDDAKMLLGVCPGRIDYLTPLAGHPLAGAAAGDELDPTPPAIAGVHFAERR